MAAIRQPARADGWCGRQWQSRDTKLLAFGQLIVTSSRASRLALVSAAARGLGLSSFDDGEALAWTAALTGTSTG
jgi:hypothetical protein